MTPRRAVIFVAIALIMAGVFVGVAALLARMTALAVPPPPVYRVTDVMLTLDAQGLGAQTLDGTVLTVRVQPWPPRAGAPVTATLVAIGPDGTLPVFPAALRVTEAGQGAGPPQPMQRRESGEYFVAGALFPRPGAWVLTLEAPLRDVYGPDADYAVPVAVTVRE
ncbi:MAG: hypothetical protein K1X39_11710 [Thermoflexales bacterium]|nr:hypothetical protein [Thermoflexales bacterium]